MHVKSFIVCLTLVKNHPQYHHTWVVKTIPKLDRGFPFGLHYRAFTVHAPFFSFPLPPCSLCFPSRFLSLRQSCVGWPFMFRSFPFLSCSFPSFQIGENTCFHFKSSNKKLPHSLFLIHYTISSSFGQFSSFLLTNVHKTPLQHFEDFFSCPFICCHFCWDVLQKKTATLLQGQMRKKGGSFYALGFPW